MILLAWLALPRVNHVEVGLVLIFESKIINLINVPSEDWIGNVSKFDDSWSDVPET